MSRNSEATISTSEKIEIWCSHVMACHRLKVQLKTAETDLAIAARTLGYWLVPKDAKPDEVFHFWVGDGILKLSWNLTNSDGFRNYQIEWRTKPSPKVQCDWHITVP